MKKKNYRVVLVLLSAGLLLSCLYLPPEARVSGSKRARESKIKTAVVEFTEHGDVGIKDMGIIVTEMMTASLNRTKAFIVYERISLNKIIEEQKLEMSGIIDDKTIAAVGKMHGVEAIVTGSVIKIGIWYTITAKIIDTETAVIIDTAQRRIEDAVLENLDSITDDLAVDLALE
jgi:TolB-like protein